MKLDDVAYVAEWMGTLQNMKEARSPDGKIGQKDAYTRWRVCESQGGMHGQQSWRYLVEAFEAEARKVSPSFRRPVWVRQFS